MQASILKSLLGKCALSLLCGTAALGLSAAEGDITPAQAERIARRYVQLPEASALHTPSHRLKSRRAAPYYIYNDTRGKGYVIVAGNSAMGTVLGHGTQASLDTLNAPDGLRWLLAAYRERYEAIRKMSPAQLKAFGARQKSATTFKNVAPLVKSHWGQGFPYNSKLGGYSLAGCVATAMSQIMYHHKWPERGVGKNAYTVAYDNRKLEMDFSQSRYDWENMLPNYHTHFNSQAANDAVGKLLQDIGIAVSMQYHPTGSGAFNESAYAAFKNNFSYNVAFVQRQLEGKDGFVSMLYREFQDGYPVYIAGNPKVGSAGHAMVADGINEKGEIHFNFGWDGLADGYFNIGAITVTQSGSEFGGKGLTFDKQMVAILAHPRRTGEKPIPDEWSDENVRLTFNADGYLRLAQGTEKQLPKTEGPDVEMSNFTNSQGTFAGDVGVAITDNLGSIIKLYKYADLFGKTFTDDKGSLASGGLWNHPIRLHIDTRDLSDGLFYLVPMSATRLTGGNLGKWIKMVKAPRMELAVKNDKVTVTEENYLGAGYRLISPLSGGPFNIGGKGFLGFKLRSLDGVAPIFRARVEILNANGTTIQTAYSSVIYNAQQFSEQFVSLPLTVDDNVQPGTYDVRITIERPNGEAISVLRPHEDSEKLQIIVDDAPAKPVLTISGFGLYEGGSQFVSRRHVNVASGNYNFGGYIMASENDFEGLITYYWKDRDTDELRPTGYTQQVKIKKGRLAEVQTYNMMAKDFNVINGHTYMLLAAYKDAGKDIFLQATDGSPREYTITGSTHKQEVPDRTYQPKDGDFVRIRLKNGNYLTAPSRTESSDTRLSATIGTISGTQLHSPETIFYVSGGGLVSFPTGRSVLAASASSDPTVGLEATDEYAKPSPLTIRGAKGKHSITWRSGGQISFASDLIIEKVQKLTVTIGPQGFCSLYLPTDATVSGAKVYTGVYSGPHIRLQELAGDVPAETACILNGEAGTSATVELHDKREASAIPDAQNHLFGYKEAQPRATNAVYALNAKTGEYTRTATWLPPFRAYLNLTGYATSPISIGLKEGLPTMIRRTKESERKTLLFNLSGQRVLKTVPGQVYIRKGQKFIAR